MVNKLLILFLLIFNVSCISTTGNLTPTNIEFSPIRSVIKSQDLKHSELVISINIMSQPKYGGGRRSVIEVRGSVKASRPSDNQIPLPNGFEIGPRIRW